MKLFFAPMRILTIVICSICIFSTNFVKGQDTLLSEGFDAFAVMPPFGWTNVKVAGTGLPGIYTRATTGGSPIQEPHTDPAEAKFNSFYFAAGTAADMATYALDFTVLGTYTVNFWMFRDPGVGTDKMEVYVNTTATSAGGFLLGTINRNLSASPAEPIKGWYNYTFTVPSTFNTAANYIIFKAISGFGYNMYMDDISVVRNVVTNPSCIVDFLPADGAIDVCRNAEITWDIVPFATGYKITMGNNPPSYNNLANNLDLGAALSYSPLLAANSTYKWKVKPYNATGIATGCLNKTLTTGASVCYQPAYYIESSCETFDFIDDFSTSGAVVNIANNNTSCSANAGNYTYFSGITGSANVGSTFNISLQSGPDYLQGFAIWMDWNIDGDFKDLGEYAFQSGTPTTAIVNGTITVPETATLGTTRLRIRSFYNEVPSIDESTVLYNEGEAEDYNLTITTCTFVTYYQDLDGDGYGNITVTTTSCVGVPPGYSANSTDCNDTQATIHPGALELCNGIDDDCNFIIDDNAATAIITPSGATTICKGVPLSLSANTGVGYTYQWIRNGGNVIGATTSTYNITKTGTYQVKVTVPGGCFATSASVNCTVNPNPSAVISTPGGTDLCGLPSLNLVANAGTGYTYLWIKDGVTIIGAVNQTYVATAPGAYRVKVFNTYGCSKTSAVKTIIASCREGEFIVEPHMELFPNPANNQFNIAFRLENGFTSEGSLTISDVLGNIIFTKPVTFDDNTYSDVISTEAFASGIYMVRITTGDAQITKQLVINK